MSTHPMGEGSERPPHVLLPLEAAVHFLTPEVEQAVSEVVENLPQDVGRFEICGRMFYGRAELYRLDEGRTVNVYKARPTGRHDVYDDMPYVRPNDFRRKLGIGAIFAVRQHGFDNIEYWKVNRSSREIVQAQSSILFEQQTMREAHDALLTICEEVRIAQLAAENPQGQDSRRAAWLGWIGLGRRQK